MEPVVFHPVPSGIPLGPERNGLDLLYLCLQGTQLPGAVIVALVCSGTGKRGA
jgi:hypothetical protein